MWKIVVSVGDITQQQVGAHHKPANSLLTMGGGVADAIKRVGGKEIGTEAPKHAPVSVGKAIATSAGRLKAKHVIHAPTMNRPAMSIGRINVRLAMIGALKCAVELGIQSIAFKGLGTGAGGFNAEEVATTMLSILKEHINKGTVLKEAISAATQKD